EELRQHFRPEFLNRVDDTIVFPQLDQDEIVKIVDLFVKKLRDRLAEQSMTMEISQPARQLLAEKGYDPSMGARPLRRTIQTMVEDQLSERILFGEIPEGAEISIDVEGEGDERELTFDWSEPKEQIEPADQPAALES
ncbi:MAG: NDP-hexose 4-ketoreductase, partial [Nesterenkonia sp.]|nr:NDP-hexose 4-ketoreductase [Nesterenkonia sp.]